MILDDFKLDGKVAIVTGASRGIGRAIARGLAEAGADVAGVARSKDDLETLGKEINALGRNYLAVAADLTDLDQIKTMVGTVKNKFGHIDILVNNAAVNVRKPVLEVDEEDWEEQMGINLKSVYFTAQQVALVMKEQRRGKIINIDSTSSVIGLENQVMYCASKGGVSQMTKGMAIEWAKYNIYVTAIGPGLTKTSLTTKVFEDESLYQARIARIPLRRTAVPEDMQGVAVFLASEASNYITGHTVFIDGGWVIN